MIGDPFCNDQIFIKFTISFVSGIQTKNQRS